MTFAAGMSVSERSTRRVFSRVGHGSFDEDFTMQNRAKRHALALPLPTEVDLVAQHCYPHKDPQVQRFKVEELLNLPPS